MSPVFGDARTRLQPDTQLRGLCIQEERIVGGKLKLPKPG